MQYTATPPIRRPNHFMRWVLLIVAIIEIAVLAAIVFWARGAAPCMAAMAALGGASASASALGAGTTAGAGAGTSAGAVPPVAEPAGASLPSADSDGKAAAPATQASAAADSAPATTQAASDTAAAPAPATSGSLNDVVDPNCVAKSAASLLTAGTPAPGPTATCGAMKAPAELKAAVKQMQQLTGGQSK